MTTDLFFMSTPPPKPPSAIQPDKAGGASSKPFSKHESPDPTKETDHESFLTTLQKMSRDRTRSEGSHRPDSMSADRKRNADQPPVETPRIDHETISDDILKDNLPLVDNNAAPIPDEPQLAANVNQLIAVLEKLGQKISSGEGLSLLGSQQAQAHMSTTAENILDRLTALKQLLGAIESSALWPGREIAAGVAHLRQLINRAMGADPSGPDQNVLKQGLNPAMENSAGSNGVMVGDGAGGGKPMEIQSDLTRVATGSESALNTPPAVKPVETSNMPFSSEGVEKADTAKPNSNILAGADADAAVRNARAGATVAGNGTVNIDEADLAGKPGDSNNNEELSRLLSNAGKGSRSGGESQMENSRASESSSLSKLINDVQVAKENPLKAEFATGEDAGSKVVKLEAGTNGSGQLRSQGQGFEKTLETTSLTRESEASSRELRNQTMDQIVRRAVIQVKGGQQEARIDLKPEFLGHVRMQVITANQQVTVKILTEFVFVKDMIENNIQQLKAELQQQGLEVDKVDVSVSRDSQGNKHHQENMGQAGKGQRAADAKDGASEREGESEHPNRSILGAEGQRRVDFFA